MTDRLIKPQKAAQKPAQFPFLAKMQDAADRGCSRQDHVEVKRAIDVFARGENLWRAFGDQREIALREADRRVVWNGDDTGSLQNKVKSYAAPFGGEAHGELAPETGAEIEPGFQPERGKYLRQDIHPPRSSRKQDDLQYFSVS